MQNEEYVPCIWGVRCAVKGRNVSGAEHSDSLITGKAGGFASGNFDECGKPVRNV